MIKTSKLKIIVLFLLLNNFNIYGQDQIVLEHEPPVTNQEAPNVELTTNEKNDLVDIECRKIGEKLGSISYEDCKKLQLQLTGVMSNK